ncbi:MAG: Spo0E family sporulation regulatory protein-aspartic acid phosphatase [Bacillota bacterium]
MEEKLLAQLILKGREKMLGIARSKKNPFTDPDVYRASCRLDELIVKYMKTARSKL